MQTIPIYLCAPDAVEVAAESIGGEALRQWCELHRLKEGEEASFVLWPGDQGGAVCVLAIVMPPYHLYACAALASRLPPGQYQLAFDYLEVVPTQDEYRQIALGWMLDQYRFDRYRSNESAELPKLLLPEGLADSATEEYNAITLVRDLINTPASDLGPEELADAASVVARQFRAKCQITNGKRLQSDYPAIHIVGQGSTRPPCLIDMRWGEKNHPAVTLVGKGVCFDTGGLDIKSSNSMKLMKKDMGGAACVLGLAQRIMATELPIRLRVLIPAVENAVDGASYRTSDVITMRSGLTVEVGNTDAEGRLVIADAMTEACSESPELLIDCATLTGAARVALGTDMPAVFSNDDTLAHALVNAAWEQQDPLWHMPLYQPYAQNLKSRIADTNSIGSGSYGGAITAALFLSRFVPETVPWLHLDMMAWNMKRRPGRPIGGEAMGLRGLYSWLYQRYGSGA